jgi:hypothetical protein
MKKIAFLVFVLSLTPLLAKADMISGSGGGGGGGQMDFVGDRFINNSATTVGTSSTAWVESMYVPSTVVVSSMAANVGATGSGVMDMGIYGPTGTLLSSCGGNITILGTGLQTCLLSAKVTLTPGFYWFAVSASQTTTSFGRSGNATFLGTLTFSGANQPLPPSFTISSGSPSGTRFGLAGIVTGGITQ